MRFVYIAHCVLCVRWLSVVSGMKLVRRMALSGFTKKVVSGSLEDNKASRRVFLGFFFKGIIPLFFKKETNPTGNSSSHIYIFHFHGNEAIQCFHSASIIRGKLVHALLAVVPPRWAMGNTSIHIAELEATLMKGPLHECAIRIICCNYYLNERILNFFTTRRDASKLATWQN